MNKLSKKVLMRHLHRANKMYANREPLAVMDAMKNYGGTHFFYSKLIETGHLVKFNGKYVWNGGKLSKKSIRPILLSMRKHRKVINDKYVGRAENPKHVPLTINKSKLREAKVALDTAIDEHIANNAPLNPTINLFIGAIEREIQAHRANGASQIHLQNVVRLTRDMEKIMD